MKRFAGAFAVSLVLWAVAAPGGGDAAVLQAQACSFTLSRTNVVAGPEGVMSALTVTTSASSCAWEASTAAPWILLNTGSASGAVTGTRSFSFALLNNTTGATRTATITAAGQTITVTQQATPCVTSLTPSSIVFPYPGFGDPADQRKDVTVDAPADCHWQPSPWPIYISPNPPIGGIGPGVVRAVSINTIPQGASNPIAAGIGSRPLTLTRLDPPCVFTLSPSASAVSVNGGSGAVIVAGTGPDCRFTASGSGEGLSITQSANAAPATISYTMTANPFDSQRFASIGVPNASAAVTQNGAPAKTDIAFVGFGAIASGGALTALSPAEDVQLTIDEQPASAWTATSTQPWLVVAPASGSGPATLHVSIDAAAAAALAPTNTFFGYMGEIRITAAFAPATAVRRITAGLTLKTPAAASPPTGVFETPLNNATTLSGAIPVTGWATDDIDVSRIQIFRDPVAGEGSAEIYIGDAIRVKGARPDIAARGGPQARRAGWGYMLLSNVLPGAGNGPFTFSAYVDDVDGHRVRLGRRTVTFDNAGATRPFGTIDVPAQGQTVSGPILNRGWVLTPPGKTIPFDGSTIKVYIDGVLLVPVSSYNNPRPDVKAFFPSLGNSNGPEARLSIDTRTLVDGVHTIAWGVIDDAGVAEGIGSRYFTVQNGAASQALAPQETARSASSVRGLSLLKADVWARQGLDEGAWATRVEADESGARTLRAAQGERIELFLDPTLQAACGAYDGHLLTGDVAGPLPVGASLDAERGIFRWQPTAAFTGTYQFVFVQHGCDGIERRVPLKVAIGAR